MVVMHIQLRTTLILTVCATAAACLGVVSGAEVRLHLLLRHGQEITSVGIGQAAYTLDQSETLHRVDIPNLLRASTDPDQELVEYEMAVQTALRQHELLSQDIAIARQEQQQIMRDCGSAKQQSDTVFFSDLQNDIPVDQLEEAADISAEHGACYEAARIKDKAYSLMLQRIALIDYDLRRKYSLILTNRDTLLQHYELIGSDTSTIQQINSLAESLR
jgi:hypothetical protein